MSEAFNKAVEEVKNFTIRPRDDILLDLYALFKQVTVGDVNTSRPFMLDFKGKAKWDAWKQLKGLSKEEAESKYIWLVDNIRHRYSNIRHDSDLIDN
ncbi:acyl-CoA-binding protein-like [Symsagittifera roscoffensis]|uniref:acyl-CoA-binding protein-like n=1 Tax=Symsagittifera roscoffensis TaxID=84072 RepID=UPI00307BA5C6